MSSTTVLSTLLKKVPGDIRKNLDLFLTESTLLEVMSERSHDKPLTDLSLQEIIEKVDESWYIEKLKTFPKEDLIFYLSLFSEKKRASLAEKLDIAPNFYALPKEMESYCLNLLFKELFPNDLPLPLSFLPDSPLAFLSDATPEKLHKLAFYLGLFDVSMELKSVLKGTILKSIGETLFPDEIAFCNQIAEYRHTLSLGQMGLAGWNEEHDILRKVIFERGLYRLSIGLSDHAADFIWYIVHTLNKESSLKIQNLPKKTIDSQIIQIVLEQIQIAWKAVNVLF